MDVQCRGRGRRERVSKGLLAKATAARDSLHRLGDLWLPLCYPKAPGDDHPPYPSPLVLLGLAAGPGSEVQRQLFSLLATMVKLSRWDMLGDNDQVTYHTAASCIAWGLLNAAVGNLHEQQQMLQPAGAAAAAAAGGWNCSSATADAAAMLPSVVILGRCCIMWAEHQGGALSQQQQQQQESCSTKEQQQDPNSCEEQQQQEEPPGESDDEYVRFDHSALFVCDAAMAGSRQHMRPAHCCWLRTTASAAAAVGKRCY